MKIGNPNFNVPLPMAQGGTGFSTPGAVNTVLASNGTDWVRSSNFLTLSTAQTITGAKTFQTIIVPTQVATDNSTNAASTAFVKAQNYQSALGFTPVQQGGGTGQGTNKIFLGWDGGNLNFQVDTSNQGAVAYRDNFTTNGSFLGIRSLTIPGYQRLGGAGSTIIQWGTSVISTNGSGLGTIAFPLAMTSVFSVMSVNGDASAAQTIQVNIHSWNGGSFIVSTNPVIASTIRVNWCAFGI